MISGNSSTSKKSGERRCSSRCASPVSIDATLTVPCARLSARFSFISSVPSNSVNLPRTLAMPMCLTENSTLECAGSTVHVPVGISGLIRVPALVGMDASESCLRRPVISPAPMIDNALVSARRRDHPAGMPPTCALPTRVWCRGGSQQRPLRPGRLVVAADLDRIVPARVAIGAGPRPSEIRPRDAPLLTAIHDAMTVAPASLVCAYGRSARAEQWTNSWERQAA